EDDLRRACDELRPIATAKGAAPRDVLDYAFASFNLARVRRQLKRDGDALKGFDEAVAALEPFTRDHPDRHDAQTVLASALRGGGGSHGGAGRPAEAAADLVRARDGFQPLAAAQGAAPEDVVNFASACTALASVHHEQKHDDEAIKEYGQAVDA